MGLTMGHEAYLALEPGQNALPLQHLRRPLALSIQLLRPYDPSLAHLPLALLIIVLHHMRQAAAAAQAPHEGEPPLDPRLPLLGRCCGMCRAAIQPKGRVICPIERGEERLSRQLGGHSHTPDQHVIPTPPSLLLRLQRARQTRLQNPHMDATGEHMHRPPKV